jgi:hypothetical protein
MRGATTIYKNLFNEDVQPKAVEKSTIREQKVSCIIDYYYYCGRKKIIFNGKEVSISYSDLLTVVSSAFFLSTFTLHDIIQNNSDQLALVKQEWKDKGSDEMKKVFSKKWPMFVW